MALIDWFRRNLSTPAETQSRPADSALPSLLAAEQEQASYGGLNFYSAIQSHQKWKARLGDYARGEGTEQLNAETICRDDRCPLGIWLHNQARVPHAQFGLFNRLVEEHAEFHRQAAEVVRLIQAGAAESARAELAKGQYARISHRVIATLSELYLAVTAPVGRKQ